MGTDHCIPKKESWRPELSAACVLFNLNLFSGRSTGYVPDLIEVCGGKKKHVDFSRILAWMFRHC